jgi:hypothetical protein
MLKFVPENFDIRHFLKRERGIKFRRAVHVAHGHAYRFDGGRTVASNAAERNDQQKE